MGRYVIIGNGIAGHTAALTLRAADPDGEITVLARERYPTYSRIMLSYLLKDEGHGRRLFLTSDEELGASHITVRYGTSAARLEPQARRVVTEAGEALPYDRLLIASGADPVKPDAPGTERVGVSVLRTLDDAHRIAGSVRSGGRAVIVGAGLISLKVAEALHKRGMGIELIVSSGQLLSTILDPESAAVIERHLRAAGFGIRYGTDVAAFNGRGRLESVTLKDGREMPANLAVIGKGVRPNTQFLQGTGLAPGEGIAVDGHLATELPAVFAAGDLAEAHDFIRGENRINAIWPLAALQGRVAALNMAGLSRPYPGGTAMNSFQLLGLPVAALGETRPERIGGEAVTCSRGGFYRRLIFRGEALAGAVTIGGPEATGVLYWLMRRGLPCRDRAGLLLDPGFSFTSLWECTPAIRELAKNGGIGRACRP